MCVEIKHQCQEGHQAARFSNLDNLLPAAVVNRVFCPECRERPEFDASVMIEDNGWIIEYDMELAAYLLSKQGIARDKVSPEFVFDERYCSWQGMSPTDFEESLRERQEIVALAKTDKLKYVQTLKTWSIERMNAFTEAGWRKAQELA